MPAKAVQPLADGAERPVPGDDFPALEQKVYQAIEMLKSAREGRATAERDTHRLRKQMQQRQEEFDRLRTEVISLRKEREEVRSRVEKLLKQIDQLAEEG